MRTFTAIFAWTLAAAVLAVPAAQAPVAVPGVPAQDGHRYLFLLDTSAAMGRNQENIEQTVRDLVASGMNGEFNPGDAFAIWPYRDKVVTDAFAPVTWVPQLKDRLANDAGKFVGALKYEGTSLYYLALVEGFKVLRASKAATLLLLSDGTEMLQGTPFDVYANTIYRDHATQLRREKKPFVTILVAVEGKIIGCTVGSGGDPITLPPIPEETKKRLAAEFAAVRAARKPVIAAVAPPKAAPIRQPVPAKTSVAAPVKAPVPKEENPVVKPELAPSTNTVAPAPSPVPPPVTSVAAVITPISAPVPPLPPVALTTPLASVPTAQPAPAPAPATEPATKRMEQKAKTDREPAANIVMVPSPEKPLPTPSAESKPEEKQLGLVTPGAGEGRTRLLLIGLGLLLMAALIVWLMIRSQRGPKRPSLISRSMGRRVR